MVEYRGGVRRTPEWMVVDGGQGGWRVLCRSARLFLCRGHAGDIRVCVIRLHTTSNVVKVLDEAYYE
jgi:hypothetical protein